MSDLARVFDTAGYGIFSAFFGLDQYFDFIMSIAHKYILQNDRSKFRAVSEIVGNWS